MSKHYLIAFDAGAGAVKIWTDSEGIEVLSQVAVNGGQHVRQMMGLRKATPPMRVEFEGGAFYVGPGAHDFGRAVENLDYDRLTGTPELRALFYAALSSLTSGHTSLQVMVGLPIEAMDADTIKALKLWMIGKHSWERNGETFRVMVEDVRCTSQPVGALFDYLLNDAGKFIAERRRAFRGEVGILSLGHSTVELLGVRDRKPVQKWTSGATLGVQRLIQIVQGEAPYSRGELDERLRAGKLNVTRALPIWWSEIAGHLDREWGRDWKRFEVVIVAGGGTILLREQLEHKFGVKVFIPDLPVMSVARGLWKLGMSQRAR